MCVLVCLGGGIRQTSINNKNRIIFNTTAQSPFLLKLVPSVSLALPPVGVQRTALQLGHITTLVEWLNTVVIWKQPVHLTSMK